MKYNEEQIRFATHFSKNYKKLKVGTYISDCGRYFIEYSHRIPDTKTTARVSVQTGLIEFDKTQLRKKAYTSDFVFYLAIWCFSQFKLKDCFKADDFALKYYLSTRRSKSNLLIGYEQLLSTMLTEQNARRWAKIIMKLVK